MLSCLSGQQGVAAMPAEPPEGRKVKSGPVGAVEATDRHERAKDYLSPAEVARLLDATKAGRRRSRSSSETRPTRHNAASKPPMVQGTGQYARIAPLSIARLRPAITRGPHMANAGQYGI